MRCDRPRQRFGVVAALEQRHEPSVRALLGDLGRRRDRITGIEPGAGIKRLRKWPGCPASAWVGLPRGLPHGVLRRLDDGGTSLSLRQRGESGRCLTHVSTPSQHTAEGLFSSCIRHNASRSVHRRQSMVSPRFDACQRSVSRDARCETQRLRSAAFVRHRPRPCMP